VPNWIRKWIKQAAPIGSLATIGRSSAHPAALARVRYEGSSEQSWILMIKPSLGGALSQDVLNYAAQNPAVPQQSTFDQVFDDSQWESHRALGQQIGLRILAQRKP
jgi:hypothetical protein